MSAKKTIYESSVLIMYDYLRNDVLQLATKDLIRFSDAIEMYGKNSTFEDSFSVSQVVVTCYDLYPYYEHKIPKINFLYEYDALIDSVHELLNDYSQVSDYFARHDILTDYVVSCINKKQLTQSIEIFEKNNQNNFLF